MNSNTHKPSVDMRLVFGLFVSFIVIVATIVSGPISQSNLESANQDRAAARRKNEDLRQELARLRTQVDEAEAQLQALKPRVVIPPETREAIEKMRAYEPQAKKTEPGL